MAEKIRIAAVQTKPILMKNEENLKRVIRKIRETTAKKVNLIVFPECCLSGYVFYSRDEALPFAETVPGPSTKKLAELCASLKVYIILGLLEKDNDKLFNAAAFIGPEGLIGKYRKIHLPFLGVDRFVDRGEETFKVYQTPIGNIGLEICYDIIFPESSRIMMLLGADILVISTNFPRDHTRNVIQHIIPTRAIENTVHIVESDRVGSERGTFFAGQSKIVDATGKILGLASAHKEEIIYGEVDLEVSRNKHLTIIPGEYEVDRLKDRRPELYGEILRLLGNR